MLGRSTILVACLTTLVACEDTSSMTETDTLSEGAPHGCVGASLSVRFNTEVVDAEALAASVVANIPELECIDYRVRGAIECIPVGSVCGFEPATDASSFEAAFRTAIADFDASLANYAASIVDACFCRVY